MANSFRMLYLYIVSLITLGMIIGGTVATVYNITSYFYPDSYVFFEEESASLYKDDDYDYDYHYDKRQENLIRQENYKNEKIKSTIVSIVVIVVGIIMYKYHWNIIEKERIKQGG